MLQEIWDNASSTAAMYVGVIFLFYLTGLFFLLIQSIKQRTEQVTCYDVYLELADVMKFCISIFYRPTTKEEIESKKTSDDDLSNILNQ